MVSAFEAPTLRARACGGNPSQSLALGRRFLWADTVYRYKELEQLLATLAENVIAPAEKKGGSPARATAYDRGGTDQPSIDPPPLKWSDLRYVFDIQEDCNGKEAIQA
jgi:hypothetical protein